MLEIDDKARMAAVTLDHALSFVVKVDFLDREHMVWLRSRLSDAALRSDPTEQAALQAMHDYVNRRLEESR